jgi:Fe-S oxidoreductase
VVFPTCIVEYQTPIVGRDLVRVLERNGVECEVPEGQVCCGAPWLHSGDVERFRKQGRKNVRILADAIRAGRARGDDPKVVVPQPTCSYVLKHDYPDYLGGDDARLVAECTLDAAEHLVALHKGEGTTLDLDLAGPVPETVTYHAPCHLRAQNIGLRSRDLLKAMGAKVTVVAECSGIDGTWGYRAEHLEASRQVARKMATAIERAGGDVVAGDCHLANGGILQETGRTPVHPVSLLARAYGIPEE